MDCLGSLAYRGLRILSWLVTGWGCGYSNHVLPEDLDGTQRELS